MDITITISDKVGEVIKEKAAEKDMGLSDFVSDLVEEKVIEDFPDKNKIDDPHPLLKMAGMFSSGKTDTSIRYKEILLEAVKMPNGFGGEE
jgi:predicted DNA binding CopG/RHH family protein